MFEVLQFLFFLSAHMHQIKVSFRWEWQQILYDWFIHAYLPVFTMHTAICLGLIYNQTILFHDQLMYAVSCLVHDG